MIVTTNTHDYDYKLKNVIDKIKDIHCTDLMSFEESMEYILKINDSINHTKKDSVIKTINLFKNNRQGNYDYLNNISDHKIRIKCLFY